MPKAAYGCVLPLRIYSPLCTVRSPYGPHSRLSATQCQSWSISRRAALILLRCPGLKIFAHTRTTVHPVHTLCVALNSRMKQANGRKGRLPSVIKRVPACTLRNALDVDSLLSFVISHPVDCAGSERNYETLQMTASDHRSVNGLLSRVLSLISPQKIHSDAFQAQLTDTTDPVPEYPLTSTLLSWR